MSRHVFLSAALSLSTLAACVEAGPDVAPLAPPTAAERPEIGLTYDVATGVVAEDLELSLDALRDPVARARLDGTQGPPVEELEGLRTSGVIFGSDTRARITPTTSFPASANVFLQSTFPDGWQGICSGSMIRGKYVLTAGHCVYHPDHGGWAVTTTASAGADGNTPAVATATATTLRSVTGWTDWSNNDYDYGLITLSRSIGGTTGLYCLRSYDDATVDSAYGYVYGYPGDKPQGQQWGSHGPIEDYDSTMIFYDIDTMGGQSGSGLYRFDNGTRCIFGVHTGATYFWGEQYNTATRITTERFNLIVSWMNTGT